MKKKNALMGKRSFSDHESSTDALLNAPGQFRKPNFNDTMEMVAEQLASLLLDCLHSRKKPRFRKLQRKK